MECFTCKAPSSTKRCSRCHAAWYCSDTCQKSDWLKQHNNVCCAPKGKLSLLLFPGGGGVGLCANSDIKRGEMIYDNAKPDVYISRLMPHPTQPAFDAVFQKGDKCFLNDIECARPSRIAHILIRKNEKLALSCSIRGRNLNFCDDTPGCCVNTAEGAWKSFDRACQYFKHTPDSSVWTKDRIYSLTRFINAYVFSGSACDNTDFGYLFDVFAGYINHSCRSNANFIILPNRICIFSRQDISKGTEITISYNGLRPDMAADQSSILGFVCKCANEDLHHPVPIKKSTTIAKELHTFFSLDSFKTLPKSTMLAKYQEFRNTVAGDPPGYDLRYQWACATCILSWYKHNYDDGRRVTVCFLPKEVAREEAYQWAVDLMLELHPYSIHFWWQKYHYLITVSKDVAKGTAFTGALIKFVQEHYGGRGGAGMEWLKLCFYLSTPSFQNAKTLAMGLDYYF